MKKLLSVVLGVTFLVMITGCVTRTYEDQGQTQKTEARFSEQQQTRLLAAHPQPILEYSLERVNLTERLERFNDPNKISYIYLLSDTGQIYTFLPIKGKVSSVNSKMSTGEQIVDDAFGSYDAGGLVVESPQEDGSYGTNGDAIFFFASDGTYFEWNGKYLLADRPFQLSEQPLLIYDVSESE